MPLFTLDSDKRFIVTLFVLLICLATGFYFYVENKSEVLARQKQDGRYTGFVETYGNEKFEIITLGTSHAETADLSGVRHFPLSAPFSIPAVMYLKAKLIVKAHPEVKVVYIEADDHILFNGPVYNLDGLNPEEKRNSKVFQWGGAFIDGDNESQIIFGKVSPSTQDRFLLFKDDVKPIIIKRIVAGIFKQKKVPALATDNHADCGLSGYPKDVDLSHDTHWSTLSDEVKNKAANVVIAQHKLDKPDPLDMTQAAYFEKTIQYLKNNSIDVVLVHYPESPLFVAKKNPLGQQQYEQFIASLVEKYSLRTVDMRSFSKYGDRFFDDQDHIDGRFAFVLGKMIMQDYCDYVYQKETSRPNIQ